MGRTRARPAKAKNRLREIGEQLKSNNLEKRLAAVDSLDEFRGKEAASLLVRTLHDESWHVRSHAARILGRFGRSTMPSLLKALSEGVWYVRAAASLALGELGDVEAVDSLLLLVDEENRTVRKEAREAISKIVKRNPQLFLREYLDKREEESRRAFLEKLKSMDEEAYESVSPAEEEAL